MKIDRLKRITKIRAITITLAALAFAVAVSIAARAPSKTQSDAPSQVRKITLPAETATYRASTLAGYEMVQAQCSTCHSAEYVLYQPPSPRAYWQATVDKMVKTFGAPIAPEQIPAIVDYLTATYGPKDVPKEGQKEGQKE